MNVDRLLFLHLIFFYIILITGTMVGSNCPGFPHTRDQPCMARNSTMGKQQSKLVSARHCPDVETWERVAYPRERYESFTDRTLKNTSGQPISLCAHNAHAWLNKFIQHLASRMTHREGPRKEGDRINPQVISLGWRGFEARQCGEVGADKLGKAGLVRRRLEVM